MPYATAAPERRRVWDLPLRLSHWSLVLAVTAAFASHWAGDGAFAWHRRAGYATLVLVAFRLAWGIVGPRHARFAHFIAGPRAVLAQLGEFTPRRHRRRAGHTPLGGWMIALLLGLLGAQAVLGLFANDEVSLAGPLYGYVSHGLSNRLSAGHALLADLLLAAVPLHVAAVLYYRYVLGDDLIRPMLDGRKAGLPAADEIGPERRGLALLLVLAAAVALGWVVCQAPEPALALF